MSKYLPVIIAFIIAAILTAIVVTLLIKFKNQDLLPRLKQTMAGLRSKSQTDKKIPETLDQIAMHLEPFRHFDEVRINILDISSDFRDPLVLVITGEFKTGKSTFINTLLGQNILKVNVTPATAAITRICYGDTPGLTAHFRDGSQQNFPFSALEMLSAEGDATGARMRQELHHVDVALPNPLLNQYTIVDTPGLNSVYDYHTQATEGFISRADMVLWLFALSNVGSKTEIASITGLGKELKPIAIINRIDELDPEEDSLEDLMDNFRNRLGDSVQSVYSVSSLLANQAMQANDPKKLQESNWHEMIRLLEHELPSISDTRKYGRLQVRLAEAVAELENIFLIKEQEYNIAHKAVHGEGLTISGIEQQQKQLQNLIKLWTPTKPTTSSFVSRERLIKDKRRKGSPLETIITAPAIPAIIKDHAELTKYRELMYGVYDALVQEGSKIKNEKNEINSIVDKHNAACDRYNKEYYIYMHSGIFGGEPIFDFSGTGKAVKKWGKQLDDDLVLINQRQEVYQSSVDSFASRRNRNDQEAVDFCSSTQQKLSAAIAELDDQKRNLEAARKTAQDKLDDLKWVPQAKIVLEHEVYPKLNPILVSINERITSG